MAYEKFYVKIGRIGDWYSPTAKHVYKNVPVFVDTDKTFYILESDKNKMPVQKLTENVVCDVNYNIIDVSYNDPTDDEAVESNVRIEKSKSIGTKGNYISKNDYKIFNLNKIREALTEKIYVSQKKGKYYYDAITQQLVGMMSQFLKTTYDLVYDSENEEFRLKGRNTISDETVKVFINGVYQEVGFINDNNVFVPLNMEYVNSENFAVDYTKLLVYNAETGDIVTDAIIYPEWNKEMPFIIKENVSGSYDTIYVQTITDPIMYEPELNKLSTNYILNYEIVLPYISESDVVDGSYIQMFDVDNEILPEWKRETPKTWIEGENYNVGDVIYHNLKYYRVMETFKAESVFNTSQLYGPLTMEELDKYLPRKYFPTLDLLYAKTGVNKVALQELNVAESQGKFWCGKKFSFFEIIFEPLYNKNIDNFGIKFYNSQYKHSPEFWLI